MPDLSSRSFSESEEDEGDFGEGEGAWQRLLSPESLPATSTATSTATLTATTTMTASDFASVGASDKEGTDDTEGPHTTVVHEHSPTAPDPSSSLLATRSGGPRLWDDKHGYAQQEDTGIARSFSVIGKEICEEAAKACKVPSSKSTLAEISHRASLLEAAGRPLYVRLIDGSWVAGDVVDYAYNREEDSLFLFIEPDERDLPAMRDTFSHPDVCGPIRKSLHLETAVSLGERTVFPVPTARLSAELPAQPASSRTADPLPRVARSSESKAGPGPLDAWSWLPSLDHVDLASNRAEVRAAMTRHAEQAGKPATDVLTVARQRLLDAADLPVSRIGRRTHGEVVAYLYREETNDFFVYLKPASLEDRSAMHKALRPVTRAFLGEDWCCRHRGGQGIAYAVPEDWLVQQQAEDPCCCVIS